MLTHTGTRVCSAVFNPSFCNQAYGVPAGLAVLTGTAVLGFCILRRMYRPEERGSKPISSRHVEVQEGYKTPDSEQKLQESLPEGKLDWEKLVSICQLNAGYTLSDSNKLPWNDRYMGSTGYIDCIRSADLTKPVMWGRDNGGRPFLACRMSCWEKETGVDKEIAVYVIFQRYEEENGLIGIPHRLLESWTGPVSKIDPKFVQFLKGEVVGYPKPKYLGGKIWCYQLDRD